MISNSENRYHHTKQNVYMYRPGGSRDHGSCGDFFKPKPSNDRTIHLYSEVKTQILVIKIWLAVICRYDAILDSYYLILSADF